MVQDKIELGSAEITAYWWVNVFKNKVEELFKGRFTKNEEEFYELFKTYSLKEWRNVYLQLIPYIMEDINEYVFTGNDHIDAFQQDTALGGHKRINEEFSKIIGKRVPDITLSNYSAKDSVIYTNLFGASVWYKSCGVSNLPTKYEPTYLITGDSTKLDFYNLLVSTIIKLSELDESFSSFSLLKKCYTEAYQELVGNIDKDFDEMFMGALCKARTKGVIFWYDDNGEYDNFAYLTHIVGLEPYMDKATVLAKSVLSKSHELTKQARKITLKK